MKFKAEVNGKRIAKMVKQMAKEYDELIDQYEKYVNQKDLAIELEKYKSDNVKMIQALNDYSEGRVRGKTRATTCLRNLGYKV